MASLIKRWQVASPLTPEADTALQAFPPILRAMLYQRGFRDFASARLFLRAELDHPADPLGLHGMVEAVDRLCYAIRTGEKIAIYGDYDADGVTATALLTQALRRLGGNVRGYIPNRFEEGYGLNKDALSTLHADGVQLVITVDCGIRSPAEAAHARQIGLDLIITDHHHPALELPECLAVINPKQSACTYQEKTLAGVGLAYKLAEALFSRLAPDRTEPFMNPGDYLDLVALGTVADLAPLRGENRALVKAGLRRIRQPIRQGVQALAGVANIKTDNISAVDIGFMLGPRLNAAGRLESALASLDLLLTDNLLEAAQLAQKLEIQNRERQKITREIQEQAEILAFEDAPDALLLFAAHPDFNPGVVGLAASRLTDRYYRPSIVAHQGEEFTRGSCRSIGEFHITEALDQCADLLVRHGGHAAAAGFTVRNENLPELKERLQNIAALQLSGRDLRPTLEADLEVSLSELDSEVLRYLNWLEPTGFDNPAVRFVSRDVRVLNSRTVGKDGTHLKLVVTDGHSTFDAIAFGMGEWLAHMPSQIDLMYSFEKNEYQGRTTFQLRVRDMKPAGEPEE